MKTPLQKLVEEGLAARSIGAVAAAQAHGLERNFIRDILSGKKRSIRVDMIERLAAAIGKSVEEVAAVSTRSATTIGPSKAAGGAGALRSGGAAASTMMLRGTASASPARQYDGFIWTSRLENLPTPAALRGASDLYGFYVSGHSMSPMHMDGDLRIAMPGRRFNPGDSVVFTTRNWRDSEEEAFIKLFVRRDDRRVVFWQINPPARIEVPANYILEIARVLTTNELFGIPPGERFVLPKEALSGP